MSQVIVPTPGRVVWYRPSAVDSVRRDGDAPLAATVAGVQSHFCDEKNPEQAKYTLNVAGYDVFGQPFNRQGVPLIQDGEEKPDCCYCEWMPYQIGQAARHSAGGESGGMSPSDVQSNLKTLYSQQNDLRASVTKSLDDLANITLEHSKQLKELSELANGPCRVVDGDEANVNTEVDGDGGACVEEKKPISDDI